MENQRSNADIKAICKRLVGETRSDEELKRRIAEELGYTGTISICSTSCGSMRMVMGMLWGLDGSVISF